jgi:nitrite reductase (NADH) small subunit
MLSSNSPSEEGLFWVPLGSVDQIGLGQGRCFSVSGCRLAVFRTRSGRFYALDASCQHRNGPLAEGIVGKDIVICPCHGYKFSLIDGQGLDNEFNVKCHAVEINDRRLYVKLDLTR